MFAEAIAFHASSITIILRMPFRRRILLMNSSMMMIVVTGNRIGWSLMESISKTMNRLCSRSSSLSELSR